MSENTKKKLWDGDPMSYASGMEIIESDIMDRVLNFVRECDMAQFTDRDVQAALSKDTLNVYDYAALLSPKAGSYLEAMARRSLYETRRHFGNTVDVFTPLYIANYCENQCIYCGFNCKKQDPSRQIDL